MKTLIAILMIPLVSNCQTSKPQTDTATCIGKFIQQNKSTWQVGSVEEYEFQGKLVYALTPSSVIKDGTTLIKSADCADMCHIGGFAGPKNGNCNGDNFYTTAVFKRTLWKEGQ